MRHSTAHSNPPCQRVATTDPLAERAIAQDGVTTTPTPTAFSRATLRICARVAAIASITIGALTLLGWHYDIVLLRNIHESFASMRPSTAVSMIALGIALALLNDPHASPSQHRWKVRIYAIITMFTGIIALIQFTQMSPTSAISAISLGLLLFGRTTSLRWQQNITYGLLFFPACTASLALLGYVYHVYQLAGEGAHQAAMALHTAIALLLLVFGILCTPPYTRLATIAISQTAGGIVTRRLLPAACVGPVLIGWIGQLGAPQTLLIDEVRFPLIILANIVVLSVSVWTCAKILHTLDLRHMATSEALSAQEAKLRRLVDANTVGVVVASIHGMIKEANDCFLNMIGYDRQELEAGLIRWDVMTPPEWHDTDMRAIEQLVTTGTASPFEKEYVRKNGTRIPVVVAATLLGTEPSGDSICFILDESSRKQVEQQLRRAKEDTEVINHELEAFSYSVSHDLRSPLRAIDGFSQAFLEDYGNQVDDRGREYLQRVRAAAQRMGQLIDAMLNLSRITRSDIHTERVDLSAIATQIVHDLQSLQPERQVHIHIDNDLVTQGDPTMLRLLLTNLLENAWKFTEKTTGAVISVRKQLRDGKLVFFVQDNGAGFDMQYAGKLFGAFQRLHSTQDFPGTGVGLAIAQRIIHRHGGQIWAESEPNHGATFFFTLNTDRHV